MYISKTVLSKTQKRINNLFLTGKCLFILYKTTHGESKWIHKVFNVIRYKKWRLKLKFCMNRHGEIAMFQQISPLWADATECLKSPCFLGNPKYCVHQGNWFVGFLKCRMISMPLNYCTTGYYSPKKTKTYLIQYFRERGWDRETGKGEQEGET